MMEERWAARLPMALFTVNIQNRRRSRSIHRATDWLNHLLFSPTDPTLLMFCHEGPWHKVDRIWTIRTDGTRLEEDPHPHDGDGDLRPRVLERRRQDHLVRPADAARRGFLAGRLQRRDRRAHLVSPAAQRVVDPLQRHARRHAVLRRRRRSRARWRARPTASGFTCSAPSCIPNRGVDDNELRPARACCAPRSW